MAGKCGQCQEPTDRAQVRVMAVPRLWVERVAAILCRSCGFIQLTKVGREKVLRAVDASAKVLGSAPALSPMPIEVGKVYGA